MDDTHKKRQMQVISIVEKPCSIWNSSPIQSEEMDCTSLSGATTGHNACVSHMQFEDTDCMIILPKRQ